MLVKRSLGHRHPRTSSAFPEGARVVLQGGESPARAGVTRRAEVRACRDGVGPLAYRGYVTSHGPAGGEGRDAEQPEVTGEETPIRPPAATREGAAMAKPSRVVEAARRRSAGGVGRGDPDQTACRYP